MQRLQFGHPHPWFGRHPWLRRQIHDLGINIHDSDEIHNAGLRTHVSRPHRDHQACGMLSFLSPPVVLPEGLAKSSSAPLPSIPPTLDPRLYPELHVRISWNRGKENTKKGPQQISIVTPKVPQKGIKIYSQMVPGGSRKESGKPSRINIKILTPCMICYASRT